MPKVLITKEIFLSLEIRILNKYPPAKPARQCKNFPRIVLLPPRTSVCVENSTNKKRVKPVIKAPAIG